MWVRRVGLFHIGGGKPTPRVMYTPYFEGDRGNRVRVTKSLLLPQ